MALMHHAQGDVKEIMADMEIEDLVAEDAATKILKKVQNYYADYLEDKPQEAFEKVMYSKDLHKQKKEIQSTIARQQKQITRVRRRLITGDYEKRVRDFAQEAKVVKTVDKFAFCLGVLVLCVTEYMVLRHPGSFGMYYGALVSTRMALRLYMYAKSG